MLNIHDKFLINYTIVHLSEQVRKILTAGPQFSIPFNSTKPPIKTMFKDLEFCLNRQPTLTSTNRDIIRARSVNIINNFCASMPRTNNLSPLKYSFYFTRKS